MKFFIVDAFSAKSFAGNPAAVFIVQDFPTTDLMQNIASEMNLSETTFAKKIANNSYHIRWFTPNSEAPLCGHATIAAMHILIEKGIEKINTEIIFQSLSGELKAIHQDQYITLNFPKYVPTPVEFNKKLQAIVNAEPIYTGFAENCFLIEFESSSKIANINPDLRLLKELECRALIITSKGDGNFIKYDFISRYFAPKVGIDEDPVCASAHCRLIPYWSDKLKKDKLIAYQLSKRGGIIKCQNIEDRVLISGQAITVMRGELC